MKLHALSAPLWLRSNAVYQINPRTFTKEGTICAITKEIPYLKALGFEILYLCPVFEEDTSTDRKNWSYRQCKSETNNPKNPYRMNDYFRIDEEYGSMADLAEFISAAHDNGMRVILDLVYLHIGPNARILKAHPEFAKQNPDGSFICTDWNFPYLNFDSPGLREYLWSNMTYYIGAWDADGFRCDVGGDVPEDFWIEGRRRIQAIKKDAVLIQEGYLYERLASCDDSCYNFDWHDELQKIFLGEMTLSQMRSNETERLARVPVGGLLLRDLDNHDTVTDWKKRGELLAGHDGMEMILAVNYTFPGIPMVYCGNEYADTSHHSMFANRFFPGKYEVADRSALRTTQQSLRRQEVIYTLNELRHCADALQKDDLQWIETDAPDTVLSYLRPGVAGDLLVLANFSSAPVEAKVDFDPTEWKTVLESKVTLDGSTARFNGYSYIILKK